jgi:2,3-bisphosphoglycerate-independent phosphoglycerate mutase
VSKSLGETMTRPKPLLLLILDGFGFRQESEFNAIEQAKTPHYDALLAQCPHTLLACSGNEVGLPKGQMGNSEVGHMSIGAGRVVYQDLLLIDRAVEQGEFARNPAFNTLFDAINQHDSALHILGLLSDGGVHSHIAHIQALIETAAQAGVKKIYVHAFLDGRDTPPKSAKTYLEALQATCDKVGVAKIVSLCGRFFAMDRDRRWDRTQAAFDLIVYGEADFDASTPLEALEAAYHRGETDEFVEPTVIHGEDELPIYLETHDGMIFMNFRADRARQLTRALTQPDPDNFEQPPVPALSGFVTLTQYAEDIHAAVAFPPQTLKNSLAEVLSDNHLSQLRIAETEKYAHVTFFFSGGREELIPGEVRELIPSPPVKTYDLKPEMSVFEVTQKLVDAISHQTFDVIICNFANADMVGHTGNFQATVQAIEAIDQCLGKIVAALKQVGGECLITADHGNAELMFDKGTGQAHTAHTLGKVPLIYLGRPAHVVNEEGTLADIAPTMLYLLDQGIPSEMTGKPLLKLD